jgi:perosamine synthetase
MHGMDKDAWKRFSHKGKWDYDISLNGYKMNMNDVQASLGLTQLKKLDKMNKKRQKIAGTYLKYLDYDLTDDFYLAGQGLGGVNHIFPIVVKKNRDEVMRKLNKAGIGTSVFFKTINRHTAFKHLKGKFPMSDYFYQHSLALPLYPDLSLKQIKYICEQVNKWTKPS